MAAWSAEVVELTANPHLRRTETRERCITTIQKEAVS